MFTRNKCLFYKGLLIRYTLKYLEQSCTWQSHFHDMICQDFYAVAGDFDVRKKTFSEKRSDSLFSQRIVLLHFSRFYFRRFQQIFGGSMPFQKSFGSIVIWCTIEGSSVP